MSWNVLIKHLSGLFQTPSRAMSRAVHSQLRKRLSYIENLDNTNEWRSLFVGVLYSWISKEHEYVDLKLIPNRPFRVEMRYPPTVHPLRLIDLLSSKRKFHHGCTSTFQPGLITDPRLGLGTRSHDQRKVYPERDRTSSREYRTITPTLLCVRFSYTVIIIDKNIESEPSV